MQVARMAYKILIFESDSPRREFLMQHNFEFLFHTCTSQHLWSDRGTVLLFLITCDRAFDM
jgi:hypothetical protein